MQGVGQRTDQRNRLGCPGPERLGLVLVTDGPHDIGIPLVVSGVQDATQFIIPLDKRIRFIDQQSGIPLFDRPENCRR